MEESIDLEYIVILYIEDVDLNILMDEFQTESGRSSSTLRMWI